MPDIQNRKIDKIESRAFNLGKKLYADQSAKWIKELRKYNSYKNDITISPLIRPIGQLFEKSFFLSFLEGWDSMDRDTKAIESGRIKLQSEYTFFDTMDNTIANLKAKKIIPPDIFKSSNASVKATAFSVQRIERMGALIDIKNSLIESYKTGLDFNEWKDNLDTIFEKRGITPITPHHIENVFRTNIHSIYNFARRQAGDANPFVEGYEYVIVLDSRTTEEICLPLGGLQYRKDDPIWGTIWPPNHYMCRSTTLPITLGYAERNNIEYDNPVNTDSVHPDFKSPPATAKGYESKIKRLENSYQKELKKVDNELKKTIGT